MRACPRSRRCRRAASSNPNPNPNNPDPNPDPNPNPNANPDQEGSSLELETTSGAKIRSSRHMAMLEGCSDYQSFWD